MSSDLLAIQILRKHHRPRLAGQALDDSFFLQSPQMAHGGRLARKSEEVLDLPGRRHEAGRPLAFLQIIDDLLLAGSKSLRHDAVNSVHRNKSRYLTFRKRKEPPIEP